jgi:hypothetical protein
LPSGIVKALLAGVALLALQACAGGLLQKGGAQALPPLEPSKGRVVFYRTSSLGAAYIPDVLLNGERVGRPNRPGVFFKDVPPGSYAVTTTLTSRVVHFALAAGEKKYIRLTSGFFESHLHPELVDAATGEAESAGLGR